MRLLTALLLFVQVAASARAQIPDPKRAFTDALGRFSVALSGHYADDGTRLTSSLAAMTDALTRWDEAVGRSRASATAEIAKTSGTGAARARVVAALTLAERGLTTEAVGLLTDAVAQSPLEVDAQTILGLIHTQLVPNTAAAGRAFRQAVAGDPAAPLQRYLLAKHLADQGALKESAVSRACAPHRR